MRAAIIPDESLKKFLLRETNKKMEYNIREIKGSKYNENSEIATLEGTAVLEDRDDLKAVKKYNKAFFEYKIEKDADGNEIERYYLKRSFFFIIPIILIVLLVGMVLFTLLNPTENVDIDAVKNKLLPGKGTVNEGEITRVFEAGETNGSEFSFSVNTAPVVNWLSMEGDIIIENPAINQYAMIAEIYLQDEEGTLIYTSPLISPNHHIQKAKLDKRLKSGEYKAICVLNAVTDDESMEYEGKTNVEMKITIK